MKTVGDQIAEEEQRQLFAAQDPDGQHSGVQLTALPLKFAVSLAAYDLP